MPPRRSTRSTAGAKGKGKAVDLTISSDDDDDDNHRRNVNSRGKQPDMDTDEAFARALQAEEDAAGRAEASGSRDEGNGSSSTAKQQGGQTNGANAALQPIGALQEQQDLDNDDPQAILREYKALFAGETRCQNCHDASGQPLEKEQPQQQQHTGAASRPHLALTASSTRDDFLNATTDGCSDCDVEFCRGCGTRFEAGSETATVDGEEKQKGECCAEARAVAIYELLASLDAVYLKDHLQKPSANGQPAAKRARKKAPPKGNGAGTGYGSGHSGIASAYSYGYTYGGTLPATSNGTGYAYESEDDLYGDGYDSWDEDDGPELENEYNPLMYEDESEFYAAMEQKIKDAKKAKGQAPPLPVPLKKNAGLGAGKKGQNQAGPAPRMPTAEETRDAEQDKIYLAALRTLASLLPQPDSPTAQLCDFLPHASLPALIELSTLPDLLATLLRNDSVPEWQRRSDVYFAMLDVLGLLGGCEATLGCLFGERREKRWSEGIGKWMQGHGEIAWEREGGNVAPATPAAAKGKGKGKGKKRKADVLDEQEAPATAAGKVIMATPLYALLKKFLVQANAFRRATAASNDFDESEFALIGICGDFATAGERFITTEKVWDERVKQKRLEAEQASGTAAGALDAGDTASGTATRGKGKAKEREWTDKEYNKACEELAYGAVELDTTKHHYSRDIAASASSRRPHSSFVHLAKELAVLSTSLPPGIWVRHDEERVDVINCMIAGPEHSPYAGGLFEFDIFLPLQYPQVSPLCWLVTTGGNTVRFNPNLYAEGKVCLSLLGTWSGTPEEMWQPMKSTILQVLLSITSMILGTNFPFYNEPGFGAPRDDERNKIYNKNVSLATARWAILEWCDDKHKNSIWADVIASHFTLRRQQIQSTVREWAKKDARLHAWEPKHNRVAGSHQLEPWSGAGGAYVYPYNADGTPRSAKEITAERNKLEQKVQGRDLVKEIDAALDRLGGWKESGWLEKLVR